MYTMRFCIRAKLSSVIKEKNLFPLLFKIKPLIQFDLNAKKEIRRTFSILGKF